MATQQYTAVVPLTFTCLGTSQTVRSAIEGKGGEEPVHSNHKYTGLKCGRVLRLPVLLCETEFSPVLCPLWPWNSTVLTDLHIYTGFIPTQLMTNTSGCCYSL